MPRSLNRKMMDFYFACYISPFVFMLLVGIAGLLLSGCATSGGPKASEAERQLAAQTLVEIGNTCKGTYAAFLQGKSRAYCSVTEGMDLHFFFKDQATYFQYAVSISLVVQNFCMASKEYTGEWQRYSWVFEKERESYYRKCRDPKSPENPTQKR